MLKYLTKRIISIIPIIFGITIIMFLAVRLAPGEPEKLIAGPMASEEALEMVRQEWGLD